MSFDTGEQYHTPSAAIARSKMRRIIGVPGSALLLFLCLVLRLDNFFCLAQQTSTPLTESTPTIAYVAATAATYFKIQLPSPFPDASQGITINVTPLGDGNPDLYADWTEFPGTAHYSYRSRNWGEDTIFVPKADAASKSWLYIGVLGSLRSSNFTIVYQIETPITLYDGQGQMSSVHKGGYAYFDFQATQHLSVTFSVTGRSKIYIGTTNPIIVPGTGSNYLWSSTYISGVVTVDANDQHYPGNGQFYMAVYGVSDTDFIVTASLNGTATQLPNGYAIAAELQQNDNAYYIYNVGTPGCQLQFSLSVVYGDPDIYVSQTVLKPNPTTCPWDSPICNISASYGGESITFDPASLGDYHVGINAYSASSYTILAQTVCPTDSFNSSATLLEDGVGQHGGLPARSYRYYSFDAPAESSDITISVTSRLGDPDIFVRNDDVAPTRAAYFWSSTHVGSDTIIIRANDGRACAPGTRCRYFILVYAYTTTDFYISASTPQEQVLLFEGQPVLNSLTQGQKQYYAISIYARTWRPMPIVISVTDLGSGNPNLLVSRTNPQPDPSDPTSYQWSAQRWSDDSVNIFPTDTNYCLGQCTYYVAVIANTATTYSIVFHQDQPTTLSSGVPQQANVAASGYIFYQFRVNPGYGQVQISLAARNGFANLLVSNQDGVFPILTNSSTYQEYVPWYTGTTQLITINEGDAGACIASHSFPPYCTYVVGVLGFSNCSYTISAVVNSVTEASLLVSGIAQLGQVTYNNWQYFRFIVSSPGQDLNIVVTATSGDPDLYISNVTLPLNTPGSFNWSSTHAGGDSITIHGATPGVYYIGLFGWSSNNASYSIIATLNDPAGPGGLGDIIQLNDGQTQNGLAMGGNYIYYMITIGPNVPQLLFTVSKLSGDPDLYIRFDASYPTKLPVRSDSTSYQWMSNNSGDDTVSIMAPAAGVYTIGVYAFAIQANFVIGAATGTVFQRLSDGVPRRGSVAQGQYSYFMITMDSASDLTITVTPFSGDPDLFVSAHRSNDHPNTTNYDWASTVYRSDAVTIGHGSPNSCSGCNYYIGVYGFFASTYMITASFGNEQQLLESVPVDGSQIANGMGLYTFDMAAISTGQIDVSIQNSNGLTSLYISMHTEPYVSPTGVNDFDYYTPGQYSGLTASYDAAALCATTGAETPCRMHIGVHADYSANFTILVTHSASGRNIPLINGRSVTSTLAAGANDYYTINVPDSGMDLVVTVQSFTGDADLYMSNDPVNGMRPNNSNAMWKSRSGGTDTVPLHLAAPGDYYIGVNGFSACRYSVTAYAYYEGANQVPVQLTDGVPETSVLGRGDVRLYSFYLSGNHADLSITLSKSLGDPDLYVSIDGIPPNRTHFQWASTHYGSDQITIQNPVEGLYLIGVYAWATSVYSLTAVTHEGTLQLVAGVSFSEDLFQGQTEYFYTDVTDLTNDLTVTVTSFNGDPDLFISPYTMTPGPHNFTWSATSFRNDSITIPANQLQVRRYYIAVNAFLNCSFTILATYNGQVQLQDGRPQHDVVLKEASKFYTFRTQATTSDVSISLTPLSGYARLYVANGHEPNWQDPTTYSWSSLNPFSSQLIVIAGNDTNACQQSSDPLAFCTYYILVRGMSDCDYSVTVSAGSGGIVLQEGRATQATVAAQGYQHFTFWVSNPAHDVAISITPINGDPDIYVVTHDFDPNGNGASRTNYQWKSEAYGGDTILALYDDSRFSLGEWEISVYGSTYSTFVIVATTSSRSGNVSTIALVDGLPVGGRIRTAGKYDYYTFQPSDPHASIAFAVTRTFGDPDVFISMFPAVPTYSSYVWQSSHSGADYVTINGADPRACGINIDPNNPCVFMVAVRGYTATQYTITVTSSMVTGQLQSGIPVFGTVDSYKFQYYYINVLSFNQPSLQISLTAVSGDPDLYVSYRYTNPNRTAYDYHSGQYGSEELTIFNPTRGSYYIGVYGWNNASYMLTATFSEPVTLAPAQPFTDSTTVYGQVKFYRIPIDTGSNTPLGGITVALSASVNGYVDMFLQNNGSMASPSQTNGWVSLATSASGGKFIYISPTDTSACWTGNCTYSLAVRARSYGKFQYTVTFYYGDDVVTLEPAVPFNAIVSAGNYAVFRSMISGTQNDISISSTQLLGDVSLWAIQNVTLGNPSKSNFIWSANSNSTQGTHIAIPGDDTNISPGFLYVAVYGETDASFSILVTTDNVLLVSGSPQASSCGGVGSVQYYFMNFQQPAAAGSGVEQSDIIFDIGATHSRSGAPIDGQFEIYITNDLAEPGNTKPNRTDSQWGGLVSDGQQYRINPTDPFYCTANCTFYIAVSCPNVAVRGGYTITASTADVLEVLAVNTESRGHVAAANSKFYQVYLASATNFSFVLEPCYGEVDLYVSSVWNKPDATHNEFVLNSHVTPDIFYYSAPHGQTPINSVFFAVQQSSTVPVDAEFNVRAAYVAQSQSDSPVVDKATLAITALSEGRVEFSFSAATPATLSHPQDLVYSIYWTTDDDVNAILYTQCGVELSRFTTKNDWRNITQTSSSTITGSIEGLADTTYQFNVFVYDPLSTSGPTAYTVQHAKPNGGAPGSSGSSISVKVLLGVGIPVAFFVLVLVLYLWWKNRRLSKELAVEMHDVPAAALRKAARGAPDVTKVERAQNFHKLLGSEDDSSDQYIAPSQRGVQEL